MLVILFAAQYGENIINHLLSALNPEYLDGSFINTLGYKNILSYSISTKYSMEGLFISIITSCITSFIIYIFLGVIFYGPTCSMNNYSNKECLNELDILCFVCQSSFVSKMNVINHICLGALIGIQSILGSLLIDIIIKSYSYKINEIYSLSIYKKTDHSNLILIWLQRFSPFIFAFAVTFYYLLIL